MVDLWGASPSATTSNGAFDGDTMMNIYSSGKQIETVVMALLVDRGLVAYSDLMTKHWPEYGQVRQSCRRSQPAHHQILLTPSRLSR